MPKYKKSTTAELVRELLSYDPDTGYIEWKKRRAGQRPPGSYAGYISTHDGYRSIRIDGVSYRAHRIIWLYVTGEWPQTEIDHINLDKQDNSWKNLRLATHKQNMTNVAPKIRKDGTRHLKGAYRADRGLNDRWFAQIRHNNKVVRLGTFDTPEEAHAAYCKAAKELFGEFARYSQ